VTTIHPKRVNHINFVPSDYDAALAQLTGFYGARFLMDVPVTPPDRACLLDLGGMYVELFTPGFARQLKSFDGRGACNLGIELQADLHEVRAAMAKRGFRRNGDFGSVVHLHGDDVHGVALEFFEKAFFGDGRIEAVPPVATPGYWRDDHPLGLMGLVGLTVATPDAAAAAADFAALLAGERRYAEARPCVGAEVIGVAIADVIVEFLAPVADGPVSAHLDQFGPGVMSDIFRVRDLGAVRRYHAERDVETTAGMAPDRIAAPPALNQGILFEFVA
jgi:hypothetical protein